jgi:hypothetical protein
MVRDEAARTVLGEECIPYCTEYSIQRRSIDEQLGCASEVPMQVCGSVVRQANVPPWVCCTTRGADLLVLAFPSDFLS